ncbi:MAG: ABC transporter permease, partial [Anaerolineaceae bacterium]|nr:ABC transporter permease [Anaerolineaceae bacterium]
MNIKKILQDAVESLRANKVRSGLTILGVVIGVAAVISLLAIGNGAENSIIGEIERIGTNLLYITPDDSTDLRNPKPLTNEDADALRDRAGAPTVAYIAPVVKKRVEATFSRESMSTTLYGVTPEYAIVRSYTLSEGEFISDAHNIGQSSVIVLGRDVAEDLFGRTQGLIGETVRIDGQSYRVVG